MLKSTVEDHTRKQVQMQAVVRNITQRFTSRTPSKFGDYIHNEKVFYSVLDDLPVTVEELVPGEFRKYINNDGMCLPSPKEASDAVHAVLSAL